MEGNIFFKPIAIIGVAGIFPDSKDPQEFWRQILLGKDFMRDIPNMKTHWLHDDYYDPDPKAVDKTYAKKAAYIPEIDFDPLEYGIPPNAINVTDTSQLLALYVTKQLLINAFGPEFQKKNYDKTSVILGVSALHLLNEMFSRLQKPLWREGMRQAGISEDLVAKSCEKIASLHSPWTEATFPGLLSNVVAGRICNRFNMHGTNCTVDAACAGSLAAMSMAIDELQLGRSDMAITGGVDLLNDILMMNCFSKTGALSFSNNCQPFSDEADGTMLGEAICFYVLKRLEEAERDNDKIYGVIRGIGSSSDGRSKSVYAPVPIGQELAIQRAYQAAGFDLTTVGLIEAHGTATKAGDMAEIEGLKLAFDGKNLSNKIALGSIKSQVGHTKSCAAATGIFKALMSLREGVLPKTIKVAQPNSIFSEDSILYLNTVSRPWIHNAKYPRRAGVSSFGFGGCNYHIVLEEYIGTGLRPKRYRSFPCELYLVSAQEQTKLIQQLETEANRLKEDNWYFYIKESQKNFSSNASLRLAIVANNAEQLKEKIVLAIKQVKENKNDSFTMPNGIYYQSGTKKNKIAFLFPGQGSQYLYMGADLAIYFNLCLSVWQNSVKLPLKQRLDEIVFPIPVFSENKWAKLQSTLNNTYWAQPALAVTSLTHYDLLNAFKVKPDMVAGHSFGEIMALYAAGMISSATLLENLAIARGEAMSSPPKIEGAMTAVLHDADEVIAKFNEWQIPLVIANFNSPKQLVFSGERVHIEKFEENLRHAKIQFARLPTSSAFHTDLIKDGSAAFSEAVKSAELKLPQIPIYSNTTGDVYPNDLGQIEKIVREQFIKPVLFKQEIEKMYQDGANVFIEVGPGHILTNLVKNILGDKDYLAVNLDTKKQDGITTLWHALAQLSVAGIPLDYSIAWDDYLDVIDPKECAQPAFSIKLNAFNTNRPYPPEDGKVTLPNEAAEKKKRRKKQINKKKKKEDKKKKKERKAKEKKNKRRKKK